MNRYDCDIKYDSSLEGKALSFILTTGPFNYDPQNTKDGAHGPLYLNIVTQFKFETMIDCDFPQGTQSIGKLTPKMAAAMEGNKQIMEQFEFIQECWGHLLYDCDSLKDLRCLRVNQPFVTWIFEEKKFAENRESIIIVCTKSQHGKCDTKNLKCHWCFNNDSKYKCSHK